MSIFKSCGHGIRRAAGEGKLLLLLWLFNVTFAAVIYREFSGFMEASLGTSAAAGNFLKGIDFNHVIEMLIYQGAGFGRLISMALLLGLIFGFISVFLSGGILHTLATWGKGERHKGDRLAPVFFQGAGKYFGRFFRLFIYSLVLWAAAFMIMGILMSILGPDSANEPAMIWQILILAAVGLFLGFLVKMIVDYARIRIVTEDTPEVLRSLVGALGFVQRRFGKALGLYYLFAVIGAAVLAVAAAVETRIETHSMLPIVAVFLIGQAFIVARNWVRVGLQAAQMDFYRAAAKSAALVPIAEPKIIVEVEKVPAPELPIDS